MKNIITMSIKLAYIEHSTTAWYMSYAVCNICCLNQGVHGLQ